jgi:hypothetical protein
MQAAQFSRDEAIGKQRRKLAFPQIKKLMSHLKGFTRMKIKL